MPGATAYEAWDQRWASERGRAGWLAPEPAVRAMSPTLSGRGTRRALDLGCGVGRHALYLAEQGLSVEALDASPRGLDYGRTLAAERGLAVRFHQALVDALPFRDGAFDYVLAWNVIYHGLPAEVARAVAEVRRVLGAGGLFQATMLSKEHVRYGDGRAVALDTFVVDGDEERGHPHYYCDAEALATLFEGFEIVSLSTQLHRSPGSWHWHVAATRR
jgi:tellurite methyltransferase